jgi:ABC-type multidrug transport system fused ATPase/permease subunit
VHIVEAEQPVHIDGFKKEIVYKDVQFDYGDGSPILQDINLQIHKGKMIAIVGQSGAGKSTLVDLLPRFYDPKGGSITIDGVDSRAIRLKDLRHLMGIVTQESILFNDTVHNNIAFGIDNGDREAVIEAAKVANAHEFISRMPQGYDTVIGDRGTKLSGGERQRLTIARAILRNPPVLILDEATSSLDTESEKLVQDALFQLMRNRTSVVIAHRLSTIQYADEILVMQEGRIIERGNHSALLARDGVYRRLVEMQAF